MSHDAQDLITIAAPASEVVAQTMVDALKDAGIPAVAFSSATGGTGLPFPESGTPGGVAVQVPEDHVAQAKVILQELKASEIEIDWDQVDVGDPEGDSE